MKNHRLDEKKIGTAEVIVDILPKGKVIPDVKITPQMICIHQTGNVDASAQANHNYMKNLNKNGNRTASWAFTVGYDKIIQAQSCNYKTYHAGNAVGNNSSIGIEICMYTDSAKQKKAYDNAIALVKILMDYYKFDLNQIKRHYDWTKKHCPAWLIDCKYGYSWTWFKNQLTTSNNTFKVKIICDELNIRKSASFDSAVVGVVKKDEVYTIVETKNGLFKLLSGAGWISGNSKYVKKL